VPARANLIRRLRKPVAAPNAKIQTANFAVQDAKFWLKFTLDIQAARAARQIWHRALRRPTKIYHSNLAPKSPPSNLKRKFIPKSSRR